MRSEVIGAGRSGLAVAKRLVRDGDQVVISDSLRDAASLAETRRAFEAELRAEGLPLPEWRTKEWYAALPTVAGAERIVLSPGVPFAQFEQLRAHMPVHVTGEIELAMARVHAPVVGITGTNGKSTVTALCGAIAEATGKPTFIGGNLGTPLVEAIDTPAASKDGLCVVELSSFQLETFDRARPRAAALLNLTPDHLDRHGSMAAYGDAKMRVARNMTGDDVLVVNGEDPEVAAALARNPVRCRVVRFGVGDAIVDGDDYVVLGERYRRSLSHLVGRHNDKNVLAALLLMRASGLASKDACERGLSSFRALSHRMELVAERGGVRYFDDSKATNVDSVVAGVDGFPTGFALIAGGRDKGGSYAPMVDALLRGPCRGVITIGEAAPLIEAAIGTKLRVQRAHDLPSAVALARSWVKSGEAVVLSPACSSFDMFRDYAHRGAVFKEAAEAQS